MLKAIEPRAEGPKKMSTIKAGSGMLATFALAAELGSPVGVGVGATDAVAVWVDMLMSVVMDEDEDSVSLLRNEYC